MSYDGTLKFDTSMNTSGFQQDASKLTSLVRGLSAFSLLQKGFRAVTDSIGSATERFDTLNRFPKIMQQMGYSAEESSAAMTKLSDGIQGLPTTLDGIVGSTKQLVIATGSLDSGVDSALALNNAFLASGATSEEASRGMVQYIQMLSNGKPDMQSWRSLQETMTYALQATAESFGFAGASAKKDLYAALRDGEITFTDFNNRIVELDKGVGGFAEVAKTATGGIGTAWTNMKTAIVRGMTGVIEGIDNALAGFGGIEGVIKGVKSGIDTAFTAMNSAMGALLPIISAVVMGFGTFATITVVLSGVTKAFSLFWAIVAANPVAVVIAAIAGLSVGIGLLVSSANNGGSATEKLTAKLTALREEISKTNEMDAQIQRYEKLKKELENTSLSSSETAAKTRELNEVRRWIIDNSNGIVTAEDEISGAFDRQLQHLKDNTEEQKALNGARLEAAMQDVQLNWAGLLEEQNDLLVEGEQLQDAYNKKYDERNAINKIGVSALTNLQAAQKGVEDAESRRAALLDELNSASGTQYKSTNDISAALERYDVLIAEAAGNEAKVTQLQSERAFVAGYLTKITDDESAATQRLTDAENDVAGALDKASAATETYVFNHLTGMMDTVAIVDGELVRMEGSLNDNADAQTKNAEAIEQSKATIIAYVRAGLMPIEEATEKYGITLDDVTGSTEELSGSTEDLGDTQSQAMDESSEAVAAYAKQFGMTVDEVVAGIDAMNGDAEAWAAEQERLQRASEVATEDYIDRIKDGNVEISESYALMLERRRKNGDELSSVEQAYLDQYKDNLKEQEDAINEYAETYGMAADEVRAEIAAMGGDEAAWVEEKDRLLHMAEVAESDYIEKIKAGNVEISASDAEVLEKRRQNGEELTAIEQAHLAQYKANIEEQEALISGYAETYSMTVQEVRAGIAAMGGDMDAWEAEQERVLRAAEVANEDYVEAIKAGNVEITAADVMLITEKRLRGEELTNIEQAKLDRWKAINEEFVAAAKSHTESIINNFEALPTKSKMSADKMIQNLQKNREQYAAWQANMKRISSLVSAETLAELEKLGPGFNSEIDKMTKGGVEKLLEFDSAVTGAVRDGVMHAENEFSSSSLYDEAGNLIDTAKAGVEDKKSELTQAGTGIGDDVGAGMEASTAPSTASQEIANAVIKDLTNADYSGITGGIAAAIRIGTSDVVGTAKTMASGVLTEVTTMRTDASNVAVFMMTLINSAIVTRTGTVKASVTAMGNGIVTALTTARTQALAIVSQMMMGIISAITSRTGAVQASATAVANAITTALNVIVSKGTTSATQMMTGVNTAITSQTGTVRTSATAVSTAITTAINVIVAKCTTSATQMMSGMNSAITSQTGNIRTSVSILVDGIIEKLEPIIDRAASVIGSMMDGMLSAMDDKEGALYSKAEQIVDGIAGAMKNKAEVKSPSRVMIRLFESVMMGAYVGMENMESGLYSLAERISGGITDRFDVSPGIAVSLSDRMRSIVDTNSFGSGYLAPVAAYAGSPGGTTYNTTLMQDITTPKPLSPSELTREGNDFLRRARWQLP